MTGVRYSRSSPARAMEALRHEHECGLVEVKGIAVWILNVLVDATRHHKQKRRTKTTAWWTFTQGKGREGLNQQQKIPQTKMQLKKPQPNISN